jgi:hypothetical protein
LDCWMIQCRNHSQRLPSQFLWPSSSSKPLEMIRSLCHSFE